MVSFSDQSPAKLLNEETLSNINGGTQEEDTINVKCKECGEVFKVTGYKKNLICPVCHKPVSMTRSTASANTSDRFDSTIMNC